MTGHPVHVALVRLEPPVESEDEVAVGLVAPQVLVPLGLAPGVVVDDAALDDLPVAVVPLGHLPAGEVLAVEERREPLGRVVGSVMGVTVSSTMPGTSQWNDFMMILQLRRVVGMVVNIIRTACDSFSRSPPASANLIFGKRERQYQQQKRANMLLPSPPPCEIVRNCKCSMGGGEGLGVRGPSVPRNCPPHPRPPPPPVKISRATSFQGGGEGGRNCKCSMGGGDGAGGEGPSVLQTAPSPPLLPPPVKISRATSLQGGGEGRLRFTSAKQKPSRLTSSPVRTASLAGKHRARATERVKFATFAAPHRCLAASHRAARRRTAGRQSSRRSVRDPRMSTAPLHAGRQHLVRRWRACRGAP